MAARRAAAAATWLWWVLPAVAAGQDVWCNEKAQRLHGGVSSSGGCVHHLADAMPEATAREVHGLLQETWASRGFHYATNCKDPGATARSGGEALCRRACSNAKHRHAFGEAARQRRFSSACRGVFSYSKFELARDHPAHGRIAAALGAAGLRARVEAAVGCVLGELTDWFASAFSAGDWLSDHVDAGLGHLAFVLNLTPDWDPAGGGALVFPAGNHSVPPAFNALAVFRVGTGVIQLPHHVSEVHAAPPRGRRLLPDNGTLREPRLAATDGALREPRLAVTGWWTVKGGPKGAVNPATLRMERGAKGAAS